METRDRTEVNGIGSIPPGCSVGAGQAIAKFAAVLLMCGACIACGERRAGADLPTLESPGVNPCLQRVASWQALQGTINGNTVTARVAQIRAAAQQIGADPEACTADLIDSALADELRSVLVLQSDGRDFPAAVIYSCTQLSSVTQCSGRTADDTAHVGEALEEVGAVPAGGQARALLSNDYPVSSLQWYRGMADALLVDASTATALAPQADGSLQLPKAGESNLLFAIGRGPAGEFHKWVWLVR